METRFKELRLEKNQNEMKDYPAKDLSKDLGITQSRISDLETGKREPTLSELQKYHEHFNVPYEYLLGENDSRYHEYMVASKEIGISGSALKKLHELAQDKTNARLLNIIIEKYMLTLLREISIGTTYMELSTEQYGDSGIDYDKAKAYNDGLKNASEKAMNALQEITNNSGHIMRLISGDENINYCKSNASEIIRKAVGEILYNWKPEKE